MNAIAVPTPLPLPVADNTSLPVKQSLKSLFVGAAMMGTAKLAFNTSVRALDVTGFSAAVTTGTWRAVDEMVKDYKAIKYTEDGIDLTTRDILRQIMTRDNGKKYAKKFGTGAAMGLAGAFGADYAIEHWDTIKDITKPIRDFTGSFFKSVSDWFGKAVNFVKNMSPIKDAVAADKPDMKLMNASFHPAVDHHSIAPAIAAAPHVASALDALEAKADSVAMTKKARHTIELALKGKSWAVNEAIDGMLNGRFGFEKNTALAVQLTKDMAAHGDKGAALKLAYMQYTPRFSGLGIEHNPKAALATVKELGRSWVGGESLLEKAMSTGEKAADTVKALADAPPGTHRDIIAGTEGKRIHDTIYPRSAPSTSVCDLYEKTSFKPGERPYSLDCHTDQRPFKSGDKITLHAHFNGGLPDVTHNIVLQNNFDLDKKPFALQQAAKLSFNPFKAEARKIYTQQTDQELVANLF
ncbi:MAG: hypothetical protein WBK77_07630 [Alphaproteobacteria bacterium]